MIDATQLPISLDSSKASTITVEIKPKQGFYQNHFNIGIPHCNNCIMQMEKCGSAHFSQMYDFCPLDLYSGVFSRMKKAINSLFLVPHRNLRIFLDGNLVHSDEKPLDRKLFNSTLFPNRQATADDLSSVLCYALSESESKNMFKVHESSVLGQLLKAQRIDPVGIIGAYSMYDQLEDHLKSILLDKSSLSKIGIEAILNDEMKPNGISDEDWTRIQILRRYFVAATMKDCSIMVSIRMVPSSFKTVQRNIIQLPNGRAFAYSIKVVDLDPKTPKNLINSHGRFLAGVKLIKLQNENNQGNAHSLKPCVEM